MKKFKQFLAEREDLYKITDDQLEKELGHDHNVSLNKNQMTFLKNIYQPAQKQKKTQV